MFTLKARLVSVNSLSVHETFEVNRHLKKRFTVHDGYQIYNLRL